MKVYLVYDCGSNNMCGDELIGVYATESAARAAVLDFLKDDAGYIQEEWEDFAEDRGFKTVQDFQDAILRV